VRRAVRADPELTLTRDLLGGLYARGGLIAEALREFEEAIRLQPNFSRARLELGLLLATQREAADARVHPRQAGLSPETALARQALQALRKLDQ
jgi:Flp pilus assembly protein TadD